LDADYGLYTHATCVHGVTLPDNTQVEEAHAVSIAAAAAEAQANKRRRDEAHRVKLARLEQELQQATAVADDLREQLHERDQVIVLLINAE
jgi:hypothetical protein